MSQRESIIRDAMVSEIETARSEIYALVDQLTPGRLEEPNAAGIWSVKDMLAHLTEWNRWNFAQIRSASDSTTPRLDGRRPPYPPEFDQILPADERNRMIYEASQSLPLDEVRTDFHAVTEGFLVWLRKQSDADMNAILGLDLSAADEPPETARFIKRVSDASAAINQMPMSQILFDSDPDVGCITHWFLHLEDLRESVLGRG